MREARGRTIVIGDDCFVVLVITVDHLLAAAVDVFPARTMSDVTGFLTQYLHRYKKDLLSNDVWTTVGDEKRATEKNELIADVWSEQIFNILESFTRLCCSGCQRNDPDQTEHKCVTPEGFYTRLINCFDDAVCRVNTGEIWHDVNCRYSGDEHVPYYNCCWKETPIWRNYIKMLVEVHYWCKSKSIKNSACALGDIRTNYTDFDADDSEAFTMDCMEGYDQLQ